MLKPGKLSSDKNIWCGLNRPELSWETADLTVFGIPYDSDISGRSGTAKAPHVLRQASCQSSPFNEDFMSFEDLTIFDAGDFVPSGGIDEYFDSIEKFISQLVRSGHFFIMIGGDHSASIPVLRGVDDVMDEDFGIVYIDAHFDLHDEIRGDRLSATSVAKRALELRNVSGPENIVFIGTRTIDREEHAFMSAHQLNCFNSVLCHRIESDRIGTMAAKKLENYKKVYLTLDIDCLDPAYAAGVSHPQFAGLYGRQLLNILHELFRNLNIIGMDIVEMAPDLDPSLASTYAARKIFQETCAHYAAKLGKLK